MTIVGSTFQQFVVLDAPDSRLPYTDDEVVEELTRAFLRYVGAKYKPRGKV